MARCEVCFRHCEIKEGGIGFCGARSCREGKVCASNYGRVTSLALDPIEKKPLNRFHPGSKIVSVGSYGCNLRCPFCQNDEISWSDHALSLSKPENANGTEELTPDELVEIADRYRSNGNIGIAFTYNEPLVGYEYVRDAAKLSHEKGMLNVLVTNGCAELSVIDEISPYIDAMNIDLKGFTDKYYNVTLGGNRDMVMRFIEKAVTTCHVELTTLIIPGENDSEDEMREITSWISDLKSVYDNKTGADVPLHISRFFPRFKMTDRPATDVAHIYHLADIAREKLEFVYTGNC
ncbi:MAG: AmmeMemoRadiSam system radical SAM enzyme [Lachnospiraceae bacterium]|nr:AmmeMemoRadiSam system radical SAM enzyme [Lachnospiraceae bacterium]